MQVTLKLKQWNQLLSASNTPCISAVWNSVILFVRGFYTRVGTLIVATIYLQLIQN